jgi:hypothetical protein
MGFWLGDDEGLRVGFLVGFAVGKLVGLKEGDAVVGDSKGDEVVHFGRENSSSCAPHVSPTDCDHTTIPFSSDTVIIADDNRQRQWVGSGDMIAQDPIPTKRQSHWYVNKLSYLDQ